MIEPLHLTTKDIEELGKRKLELGRGTDGIVYKTGSLKDRNSLYKIYYHPNFIINDPEYKIELDSNGVNIADNRHLYKKLVYKYYIGSNYYNKDGVKLYGIDTVYKAIERQQFIKRTKLQKRPIIVDGRFAGTVLHYHRFHLPIHLLRLYPPATQIKVLKELLLAVEELITNFIYPIDLCLKPTESIQDSNVLISFGPNPKPAIIDLDGKSAIYTETYNEEYFYKALTSFKTLVTEILLNIDIEKLEEIDFEFLTKQFLELGLNLKCIEALLNTDLKLSIPEINEVLDNLYQLKKAL